MLRAVDEICRTLCVLKCSSLCYGPYFFPAQLESERYVKVQWLYNVGVYMQVLGQIIVTLGFDYVIRGFQR